MHNESQSALCNGTHQRLISISKSMIHFNKTFQYQLIIFFDYYEREHLMCEIDYTTSF